MRTAGCVGRRLGPVLLLTMFLIAGCRTGPPHDAATGAPPDRVATPPTTHSPSPATTTHSPSPATTTHSPSPPTDPSAAPPVSVTVPSVGIRSDLVRLGLNEDGTMEVPADYDLAGWYVHGPRAGEIGPAVIAGHVDSKAGPAVFYRLRDLTRGDRIEVGRADGSVAIFSVDALEQYPKDGFPTAKVYGDLDHAGLRLITCGGEFDRSRGHYRDNIVVYASLADER